MNGQENLLDYETIRAATAGEKWATEKVLAHYADYIDCLLYTSPSPRDVEESRMPSSA